MLQQIATQQGMIAVSEGVLTEDDAKRNKFEFLFSATNANGDYIGDVWEKDNGEMAIVKPYLVKDDVPTEVVNSVAKYLAERNLGELLYVQRMTNHPEDSHWYGVIVKKGDYWIAWTCWNQSSESLNFGHYCLDSYASAMKIINDYYHDCRDV